MSWTSLLAAALNRWTSIAPSHRRRKGERITAAETLEERLLLSGMTFEVTNTNDNGPGSLREAIALANDPANPGEDTIVFARSVRGTIALSHQLSITDDLTIDGPGAGQLTVSGEGATRVFAVYPSASGPIDVSFEGLTIANGLATDAEPNPAGPPILPGFAFGGGIFNVGNNVSLERVRMENNQAGILDLIPIAAGGAIANEFGGTLTVMDSRFTDNRAVATTISVGGAIAQDLGPTADGAGTAAPVLSVTGSQFSRNRVETNQNDPGSAGPFAAFAGYAFGGAISNLAGEATISHSTFSHNSVKGGDGVNGNIGGTSSAGAIFTDDFSPFDQVGIPGRNARLLVENSRFLHNEVVAGDGDGAAEGGAANGGAIAGSITFFPDAGTIRDSEFIGNSVRAGDGGSDGGAGGIATGGAINANSGANFQIEASTFRNNRAQGGDGVIGGEGRGGAVGLGILVTNVKNPDGTNLFENLIPGVTIVDSTLHNNRAIGGDGGEAGDGLGGGLAVVGGSTANVSRSLLAANAAIGGDGQVGGNGQGGGIYNAGTVQAEKSVVMFNRAIGGHGDSEDGLGQGGGVFNEGLFNVDLVFRLFTRLNQASDEGDDIFGELMSL